MNALRHRWLSLSLFAAATVFTLLLCILINRGEPALQSGEPLPAALSGAPFSLSSPSYDEGGNLARFAFPCAPMEVPLALTLCEMDYFEVSVNGDCLARYAPEDAFARVRNVVIPPEYTRSGRLEIAIRMPSPPSRSAQRLSTKVFLGGLATVQTFTDAAQWISIGLVGMEGMLILLCLLLYAGKPSEKYLLAICCLAALSACTTLLDATIPIVHLPKGAHLLLRSTLIASLIVCTAMLCMELIAAQLPRRVYRALTGKLCKPVLALMIVLYVTMSGLPHYSVRFLGMRWLFAGPVIYMLVRGPRGSRRNGVLLMGYALCEAPFLYLSASQMLDGAHYGLINGYFRIGSFSYLFMLLACMAVTAARFSGKFREAESYLAQLRLMNEELDTLVETRTRALRSEQEQRRTMMLNIFHDLRNPLFIMRVKLKSLHGRDGEDEAALEMLRARTAYLERLTEDLFLYAKLEGKDVLFTEDCVNLSALLRELVNFSLEAAGQKGVSLTFSADGDRHVWGDDCRLQQAFDNLISNALDYTPPNGHISVALAAEGESCVVRVRDTGKGIRAEDMPHVFERYFRTTDHVGKSSGLGLAIAREILLAHHGELEVASTRGEGTCFTARLPLMQQIEGK